MHATLHHELLAVCTVESMLADWMIVVMLRIAFVFPMLVHVWAAENYLVARTCSMTARASHEA